MGLPEISPDGEHVLLSQYDPPRTTLRVVRLADGRPLGFEVPLTWTPAVGRRLYVRGRARWLPDGRGVAYVDEDEGGRSSVFGREFWPGLSRPGPARPVAGFDPDLLTESFGISPDGRRITLATRDSASNLVLASGVAGVD